MTRHKLNEDEYDKPTKLGEVVEKYYGVSKNGKIRILHPIGLPLYLFTLFVGTVVAFLSFDEPPYKLSECFSEIYAGLKDVFECF